MLDPDKRHHGLSAREQEIMDLHDAGISEKMIATELGIKRITVRGIVQRYDFTSVWNASNDFDRMVRQGSRNLAAACAASGGQFA